MSIFSSRLKSLRISNKLTQKDIAENIGITVRAYQYYEADEREPYLSNLCALAKTFKVSLDYLVGNTDNPEINH